MYPCCITQSHGSSPLPPSRAADDIALCQRPTQTNIFLPFFSQIGRWSQLFCSFLPLPVAGGGGSSRFFLWCVFLLCSNSCCLPP